MQTRIIVTGGTIDKQYNLLTGELNFGKTHVRDLLARGRFTGKTVVQELFMKDSLDLTDEDMLQIAVACEQSDEDKIVITHGTDTMVRSGHEILQRDIGNRTIVLTGAMIPYSFGASSDAQFNFGAALAYAQVQSPGVYVAMNGQCFDIDNVRKDTSIGMFTELPATHE